MKQVTVYGLCSFEDGKIRYIGQTIIPLGVYSGEGAIGQISSNLAGAAAPDAYTGGWSKTVSHSTLPTGD